jgi:hypothetical protein
MEIKTENMRHKSISKPDLPDTALVVVCVIKIAETLTFLFLCFPCVRLYLCAALPKERVVVDTGLSQQTQHKKPPSPLNF